MSAPYPTYEDEEEAMYRESREYRDEPVDEFCRRCDEPVPADCLREGLCSYCMEQAGLVECTNCCRVFVREIAFVEHNTPMRKMYWCPTCYNDKMKGRI